MKSPENKGNARNLRSFLVASRYIDPGSDRSISRNAGLDVALPHNAGPLKPKSGPSSSRINSLALHALKRVSDSDDFVGQLIAASLSPNPNALPNLVGSIHKFDLAPHDLVFGAVPAALRSMGDDWLNDAMSWVSVSVASSRLQSVLTDYDLRSVGYQPNPVRALILVPKDDDHAISAIILQKRLQVLGHFADLILDATPEDIISSPMLGEYDIVALSVNQTNAIKGAQTLSDILSKTVPNTPRLLGGYVVTQPLPDHLQFDLLSNDIVDALGRLGFSNAKDRPSAKMRKSDKR